MDLLPGGLDVVGHLGVAVRGAVEVPEHLRPVLLGLEQVVQLEAEPLMRAGGSRCGSGRSTRRRRSAICPSANAPRSVQQRPPIAARRLVHVGEVSGVAERVGGAEPGESGADDDDLRRGGAARGRGEPAESGEPERGDAGLLDEAAPRRRPLRCGRCRACTALARGVRAMPRTMHAFRSLSQCPDRLIAVPPYGHGGLRIVLGHSVELVHPVECELGSRRDPPERRLQRERVGDQVQELRRRRVDRFLLRRDDGSAQPVDRRDDRRGAEVDRRGRRTRRPGSA